MRSRSGRADSAPREAPEVSSSIWRRAGRLARPLLITISAAVAFMALLRLHHSRFETGMVRAFQKQQMQTLASWADSVEGQVAGIRRDLFALASHPDVCRLSPAMQKVLSSFLSGEHAVVEGLEVLDNQGQRLMACPSAWQVKSESPSSIDAVPAWANQSLQHLAVRLPIELDGRRIGTLQATVNLSTLAIRSQPRANGAYRSLCCLLAESGQTIYASDAVAQPREVVGLLSDADAVRVSVDNLPLLPYVAKRCAGEGGWGLAEVIRPDDHTEELVAFAPVNLEGGRLALVMGAPRAEVSVPIASHERVTYALIVALALLYFATGYTAYRSERAHTLLAEHRRKAAEEAAKAKGEFLAKMSHELRTPMNGMISMTELALGTQDATQRQKYLRVVKDCGQSLLSIVSDILDMSKIDSRKLELAHAPMNVAGCVARLLASLAPLAKEKGLSLRWSIESGLPGVVIGDAARLGQVLNNLVGNAIKYAGKGEVAIRVRTLSVNRGQAVLQFEVRDAGPGMSEEDQKRIFRPYYQCSASSSHRKDSTGLGLAIAQQLVELMGGQISVHSRIGVGTTFTFTTRFELASLAAAEMVSLPSLRDAHALVVSGLRENLQRLCGLVGGWTGNPCHGVALPPKAQPAESLRAALAAMKDAQDKFGPFALVIFDSSGDSIDGLAFAETLAVVKGYESAALTIFYSSALHADALRCLQTNVAAYVEMSADDEPLHLALRLAVQQASQRDRAQVPARGEPETTRLTVLVVDDDPVNQLAASELLRRWGHNVTSASSGDQALGVLAEQEFHLVLMDLEMPGLNGIETTRQIRRRSDPAGRTPIIAMTARASDGDRQACLEAGMDAFISKPFDPDQLRRLIVQVCQAVGSALPPPDPATDQACRSRAGQPIFDPAEALSRVGGNDPLLRRLVATFLEDLHRTLPASHAACQGRDMQTLASLAHRWKGSLGLLGARRAAASAMELEEAFARGNTDLVLACFKQLSTELLAVEEVLLAWQQSAMVSKTASNETTAD